MLVSFPHFETGMPLPKRARLATVRLRGDVQSD